MHCGHDPRYRQRLLLQRPAFHNSSRGFLTTPCRQGEDQGQSIREAGSSSQDAERESSGQSSPNTTPSNAQGDHPSDPSLSGAVRSIMRNVAHPAVVITAGFAQAMTVSSFNTITLDPPMVSFNVRKPSRTLDAIKSDNGRFRVHILKATPDGARIADIFSRGNAEAGFNLIGKRTLMRFDTEYGSKAPRINLPCIFAALDCQLVQDMDVKDHVVAIANVNGVISKYTEGSTLMYVQGNFIKGGEKHETVQQSDIPPEHMFYTFPVFPGDKERHLLKERLECYVKARPGLFNMDLTDAAHLVQHVFGMPPGAFGISTEHIIAQAAIEAGHQPAIEPHELGMSAMYQFHGVLSPRESAVIVDRTKKFVRKDPTFLALPYSQFLQLLGIGRSTFGLLARDILDPLRKEGLVSPFPPIPLSFTPMNEKVNTLEHMERVEHIIQEYLRETSISRTQVMNAWELAEAAGVPWARRYVARNQTRLRVDAIPDLYDASSFDISGEVTLEESRVVVRRIMSYLLKRPFRKDDIRRRLVTPQWEILRSCNVHPMISGCDIDYFLGKLRWYFFKETWIRWKEEIAAIQTNWLEINPTHGQTVARINDFVDRHPRHAVEWSVSDILAAIGVYHVQLNTGTSVNDLIKEALWRKYLGGTQSGDKSVAEFMARGRKSR
ncbi:hypothetical protein K469DRAFT_607365 [Zopfia rhizophila CBS 207.26]|uniref:Flavin reductase like domain-containing protein n=1 Tax=Zopfia rhizophila CBS 207.26 TaxID=1314779 RepID=A0A6A6DB93_9PEZI|nr:hypothetical protein K469DRAFT_607365 [Zopfia rhizophila CBS 207.26]